MKLENSGSSFLGFILALFIVHIVGPTTGFCEIGYSFKSVWNERKSYDSNFFPLGTFNDIIGGVILTDVPDPESINYSVKWTPSGGTLKEKELIYIGVFAGGDAYLDVLGHDVTSFTEWENISYDFYLNNEIQPPSIFVNEGVLQELPIPTSDYCSPTKFIEWDEVTSARNYRVRILGSSDPDDILFDSPTIRDQEFYQFPEQVWHILDAGAITAIEARQFKSMTELYNTSIYITQTPPFPDFDHDRDIDGSDLATFSEGSTEINVAEFSAQFGIVDCL